MKTAHIGKWVLEIGEDEYSNHIYLQFKGKPGQISIKADDEGFVVDILPNPPMDADGSVASTYALYNELM